MCISQIVNLKEILTVHVAMKGSETSSKGKLTSFNPDLVKLFTLECIFHGTSITTSQEGGENVELRNQCLIS